MKYIVMQRKVGDTIREVPILFPNELVHQHVAKALLSLPGNPYDFLNKVAAAGEVTLGDVACFGHSDTLKIGSRDREDERLIFGVEYGFGVKSL